MSGLKKRKSPYCCVSLRGGYFATAMASSSYSSSTRSFSKTWAVGSSNSNHYQHRQQRCCLKLPKANHHQQPVISRRSAAILISVLPLSFLSVSDQQQSTVLARERRNKKKIPLEEYLTGPDGIKYYDISEGKGPVAEKGSTVQVHFDCIYRGITAVSSRESKILAGNRIIAQPYEFQIGAPPGKERKREFVDNPNGLFSAQAAPKPPKAMYTITEGMKVGGKRTVIVPPEAGYGQKGMNEIPPGATFELNIELLEVKSLERT